AIANTGCASPRTYALTTTVSPNLAGSIATSPAGTTYQPGTVISLTATAATGYRFTGWRVNGNGVGAANPLVLTMNGDYAVEAAFEKQNVLLTLSATSGGQASASPPGPSYQFGTAV